MNPQTHPFETQFTTTVRLNSLLSLPQSYGEDSAQRWPLILFLHGAGERGDDLERVKIHGIIKVAQARPDFPFIAVAPQCPQNRVWSDYLETLAHLLDEVSARHAVDADRVYLTGLSMGGYGSWHLATEYPQRFAAVVPICGGGHHLYGFPERVCALREVPVWAFHGARDAVVPLRESEALVESLRACGGDVRLTIYPDAEHDSWTRTYDNPALYEWFLAQRRKQPVPGPA